MESQSEQVTGAEDVSWDLSDFYQGVDDPAIDRDLDAADRAADAMAARYRGHVAELGARELGELLQQYESIGEISGRAGSYAFLSWSTDTADPARGALLQRITERTSQLSQKLVFFELEWANAPDSAAAALLADPALTRFRHFLELARRYRPHLLSEPEEKILSEKDVTGRAAWSRFFDEVQSAARFEIDGQTLTREQVLSQLYHADREVRRKAAASITAGLQEGARVSGFVFNTVLADKAAEDRLRHYPAWLSARNMANEVADATVQALVDAVTSRYDIVARYYTLKRRLLGLDELFDFDRYAPLPAADRRYRWDEARTIVLEAYRSFHPRMADTAALFFERHWIDAPVRPNKRGGAFSASTVPSVHPYVMLNFEARPRDVTTVAHELGHGVHQYLSRPRGLLEADTPLTMAETASVFGEMLAFQEMLRSEPDQAARLALLTAKIEDAFATVFRQVAMNRFEDAIHTARRSEGELPIEGFNELWLSTQKAMFGESVTLTPDYRLWWSYIPHFIHTPGYVYAYAFGQLLVLALYARYQQAGPAFAEAYLDLLAAGGSDWPHELVKPLGVDLTDPAFWHNGLRILEELVAEAETLAAKV
jgi:oligoendopeptidase F